MTGRTVTSDHGPFPILVGNYYYTWIAGTSRFEPSGQRLEPNEATHTHVRTELKLATLGDELTYGLCYEEVRLYHTKTAMAWWYGTILVPTTLS